MSACETCWAVASRRAFMLGGSVVDRYREVLAEACPHDHEADVASDEVTP